MQTRFQLELKLQSIVIVMEVKIKSCENFVFVHFVKFLFFLLSIEDSNDKINLSFFWK
jgi:hypothetical protein